MKFSIPRRKTRPLHLGDVPVGADAPITVQSMTNTPTADVAATVNQIGRLTRAGCEIVRVAVPDEDAARAIAAIKKEIAIPLVADIHFDYRLALAAARAGADALRINPGNIGDQGKVRRVVAEARARNLPIRIGVNAGSLEKGLLARYGGPTPAAMVASAQGHIKILEDLDFQAIKISLKASDVPRTLAAYRGMAACCDYPFHLGVTEAGGLYPGITKSALGIGMLLAEGIGDTLRVSLTRDPLEEVRVGFEILRALEIRRRGPEIVSCPTCGRCGVDLFAVAEAVEQALLTCTLPIRIAIMGCAVNGPGEAKEADLGIAGGKGLGLLFRKGRVIGKVPENQLVAALMAEVRKLEAGADPLPQEDPSGHRS